MGQCGLVCADGHGDLHAVAGLMASNYDITDLYIDGILKVLDHDINRLGVVLDEMAAIAGDAVKVTVTVSADEAALPHDVKKYL